MKRQLQGARDLLPAPGEVRLVQAFVNTADREAGTDDLASPRALSDWLVRHGLLPAGTELDAADHDRALEVREGWRALFAGSRSERVVEALDRALAAALLRGRVGPAGEVLLEPATGGLDGALGRLLAIISKFQTDGRWQRLKVCASSTCRAVFYDRSGNHSARWCRPRCGNRLSSRASKQRQRRADRKAREARRRARERSQDRFKVKSLSELEADPEFKDLARMVRENEDRG